MRKLIGCAVFFALGVWIPGQAEAQRRPAPRQAASPAPAQRPSLGPELAFGTETDLGLGARLVFGLRSLFPAIPLDGHVGFQYFFPSEPAGIDLTYWEANANVAYRLPNVRGPLAPYLGGGVNVARASADTVGESAGSEMHVGLNLVAGSGFRVRGTITPFVEARLRLGGGDEQLVIAGGARFRL